MWKQLSRKITNNYFGKWTIISLIGLWLIWLNLFINDGQLSIINFLFFLIYFLTNLFWLDNLLKKVIKLKELNLLLSAFCLIYLISFFLAIPIVIYRITPLILVISLSVLTIILAWLNWLTNRQNQAKISGIKINWLAPVENAKYSSAGLAPVESAKYSSAGLAPVENTRYSSAGPAPVESAKRSSAGLAPGQSAITEKKDNLFLFSHRKIIYPSLLLLISVCGYFLWRARTGQFILSQWWSISPFYLYAYLGVLFLTGLLIFSYLKTYRRSSIENAKSIKQQPAIRQPANRVGIVLLIIILVSLLSHLALPLVYQAGCGGDKWRHLAAEQWLSEGKVYAPAIFGQDKVEWQSFGPIKIPAVLLTGNKTSYAGMWGLTMAISWISGIPLFYVDLWLGLLLWSIFLPLLLYLFAGYFWRNKRWRCLLAFIPILFYPIQFYGGLTLPVSFSFLWFLWVIILFCEYLRQQKNNYLSWLIIISVGFLYFGYVLYLVLGLEILLIAWLIKRLVRSSTLAKKQFYKRGRKLKLMIVLILCLIIFSISLPLLDTGYHYSHFKSDINLKYLLKSTGDFINRLVFGQGIFLQSKFVEQEGLIYMNNQEMQQSSQLVNFIPWPFLLTPLVWLFVIWGIIKIKRMRYPRIGYLLFVFLCLTLINQFIGANLMEGSHLFTKRLTVFTSCLIIIFFAWGLINFLNSQKIFNRLSKTILIIIFLSFLGITTAASGPKMQTVTGNEWQVAKILWPEIKITDHSCQYSSLIRLQSEELTPADVQQEGCYCVLGNTWPLLSLEAISGRKIIAGGFPVYLEYDQPERVQLFQQMNETPTIRYLEKSLAITGAKDCYFMTESRWLGRHPHLPADQERVLEQLTNLLGEPRRIGQVLIWYYVPKS